MVTGRPKPALKLTPDEQIQLRSWAASRTLPHALVARARLVLWSVQGQNNSQIARRLHWTNATVGKWRQRFVQFRLAGLYDELRPGRPRIVQIPPPSALACTSPDIPAAHSTPSGPNASCPEGCQNRWSTWSSNSTSLLRSRALFTTWKRDMRAQRVTGNVQVSDV